MKVQTAISQVQAIIANFNVDIGDIDPNYIEDHAELEQAIDTMDTIQDILSKAEPEGKG